MTLHDAFSKTPEKQCFYWVFWGFLTLSTPPASTISITRGLTANGADAPQPSPIGFHTRANPKPSKSFTFVVASSLTP